MNKPHVCIVLSHACGFDHYLSEIIAIIQVFINCLAKKMDRVLKPLVGLFCGQTFLTGKKMWIVTAGSVLFGLHLLGLCQGELVGAVCVFVRFSKERSLLLINYF